jgi:DNA-binding transcriptional LysR family regulator
MAIELRHLRYFLAVYEELHFGRAAERVHIAQPPLSRAIRLLEAELGVQLFNRTSRKVTPTEAGEVFADHARNAIVSYNLALAAARRVGGGDYPLRIGCVPYLGIDRVQRFLTALRERLPTLRAELTDLLTMPQVHRLLTGELDLGLLLWIGEHPQYAELDFEPMFAGEAFAVLLAPDHPLAAMKVVRPADLRSERLLMFGRTSSPTPAVHEAYIARYAASGYAFDEIADVSGSNLRDVVIEVARGNGVAFAPAWVAQGTGERPAVIVRPIDPPVKQFDVVVAWRRDPPDELRPMVDAVRPVAKDLWAENQYPEGIAGGGVMN